MSHETAKDAADRYLIGLLTWGEAYDKARADGLTYIQRTLDGRIIGYKGAGFNSYVITLAEE